MKTNSEMSPTISVITPTFNSVIYIEKCIKSICDQELSVLEHIIIDGGSTDGTIDILKKYAHLDWISEPDKGQSDALNKGFLKAKGSWILWLNSDDVLLPNALNYFVNALNANTDSDLFYGHMNFIDSQGKIIRKVINIPYKYKFTLFGIYTPPSTGTFFKSSFLKENLLDSEFHFTMDTEWFLRCGERLKTKNINKTLVSFRFWENNKTFNNYNSVELPLQHQNERKLYLKKYINPKINQNNNLLDYSIKNIKLLIAKIEYYTIKSIYAVLFLFINNNKRV